MGDVARSQCATCLEKLTATWVASKQSQARCEASLRHNSLLFKDESRLVSGGCIILLSSGGWVNL